MPLRPRLIVIKNEDLQHEVTISHPFYMSIHEVTQTSSPMAFQRLVSGEIRTIPYTCRE